MECLAASQLAHLLSSAATADMALRIDAHVDTCVECRQLLLHVVQALSGSPQPAAGSQDRTADSWATTGSASRPTLAVISRRYRILGSLGEGGMGHVYRAYDRLSQTEVALKQVLLSTGAVALPASNLASYILATSRVERAASPLTAALTIEPMTYPTDSSARQSRFSALAEEFRTLATLRHPHIVSVLDYGFDPTGHPFYTMELLPAAQPLLEFGKACSLAQQTELLLQLLDALTYLHRRGILHRDLSSNNVLVVQGAAGPEVKVVDFGLALSGERGGEMAVVGTPLYMAPELFFGERASERSDLYAVGVLSYQLFSGRYPFLLGQGGAALLRQILTLAPDLSRLPAAVAKVVGRALAKLPADRPADASTLRRELASAVGIPPRSEPAATRDSYLVAARFVGRVSELQSLRAALAEAQQGVGSGWLLCGESGVGKSRLLEELRGEALRRGALTLRGQALIGGDAYHLWREVLRHLALQVSLDEQEASTLGSLVPELPRLLERAIAAPPTLEPTGARLRLFHVIGDLLARLPETTLLLLEDLQWADAESLALLSHLQSDFARWPLLLVATCREDDGSQTPLKPLTLQRLRLPRLLRPEMEALCLSMIGEPAKNPELLDLVAAESEGNVYFIVELMRELAAESGSLAEIGSGGLPRRVMTGGITQVLGRRLARAPVSARPLLALAAVAGRELDLRLLSHRLPDTTAQLAALADVGLIEFYLERWRFSHDKLREQVCDSLSPEEQIRLHRDIAAGLEAVYPDDTGHAAQIARHSQQANDLQKAARYYRIAGDAALRRGAPGEAVALLERAQALHGRAPTPKLDEARLWRGLTEARFGLGRLRESEAALRELCRVAGTPLPHEPLHLWARVARLVAELLGRRSGLAAPPPSLDATEHAIAAELLAGLGVEEVFVWTDQPAVALLCTLFGISLEDRLGLARRRNYHRSALFFILSNTPLRGLCLRYMDHIVTRDAAVLSGTHAEIDFLRVRAMVELNDGQIERASTHARQAVALARAYKDDLALLHSLLQLQLVAAAQCEFEEMLAVSREMEPLAKRADNARYLTMAFVGQGAAQLNIGEYADATRLLERARAYLPEELGPIPESVALSLLASALRHQDQFERATEYATQALAAVLRARFRLVQLRHPYVCILDAYLASPQPSRYAAEIATSLSGLRRLAKQFPQAGPDALLFSGLADWRFGRPQGVARQLRQSIADAKRLRLPQEHAIAEHWLGLFAQSRAGAPFVPEGPIPHLQAALRIFEQQRAAGMVARIHSALRAQQL